MEATLTTKDLDFLKSLGLMFDQIRVSRNYDHELWFRLYHKGDIILVDEAPKRLFRKVKLDTLLDCKEVTFTVNGLEINVDQTKFPKLLDNTSYIEINGTRFNKEKEEK